MEHKYRNKGAKPEFPTKPPAFTGPLDFLMGIGTALCVLAGIYVIFMMINLAILIVTGL